MNEEGKKYVQITEEEYNRLLENSVEYVKIPRIEYEELKRQVRISLELRQAKVETTRIMNAKQFAGKTKEEIAEMMRERAKKSHEARRRNKALRQSGM